MTNEASLSKWLQEVRARLIVVGQKLGHHCREVIALQHVRVTRINGTVPLILPSKCMCGTVTV